MKKITAIIVDDEELARKRLARLLLNFAEEVEIIGQASDGTQGLELAEELRPELLFLDIEMPGLTGLEMLGKLSYKPLVVFATAYDHYAVKAFEKNSVDYLLKPIELDRLTDTIQRLKSKEISTISVEPLQQEIKAASQSSNTLKAMPVKLGDRIILVPLTEIAYFEAADKYVTLHHTDGREFLVEFSLNQLEQKLPSFYQRIHRALLVNMEQVKEFRKGFNGALILVINNTVESKLHTGKTYIESVRRWLDW
jgi:two-component system LytT family response regulator